MMSSGGDSRKSRLKEFIHKKIFKDDNSYADGEYEKENNANIRISEEKTSRYSEWVYL